MPARIYALAKELEIDSKILVDLCAKAGVTGKGSALASLTDEEVDKVKAYVSGGGKTAARPEAAAPAPTLPTVSAPAPVAVATNTAELGPVRREDYIAPGGMSGSRPQMLGARPLEGRRKPASGDAPRPVQRSGPAIRLAQMPAAEQPVEGTKANEPAPQKPDIKLPVDVIRGGRAGAKPLQEHMKKHEAAKRKSDTETKAQPGKPGGRGPGAPAPAVGLTPLSGRDRGGRRGRGATGIAAEAEAAPADRARKRATGPRRKGDEEESGMPFRRGRVRMKRMGTNTAAPRKGKVILELPISVRSFSEAAGVPVARVLGKLLALGTMSSITAQLEAETAELLAVEFGIDAEIRQPQSLEEQLIDQFEEQQDDPSNLESRPPIVTFLGHVDHGKTSLLDRIIGINVVSGESGGITQHIRAYKIEKDGRPISFVDTPGHEAFTAMRARGANVTDIAVLVVAADDGVMPQTEEAISHARAAGVPIVVALNKMDLPGVNLDRIFQQLATAELLPTEWGGDTEVVRCSALTGDGIDLLLETLLTIADLHEFKANPDRSATGTCLEAELHEGRGVVAKLIVQNGTLKVGDVVVCGSAHGRVKAMYDTLKTSSTHALAGPSTPVNVTGFDQAPGAGDHFHVLDEIAQAREIAATRASQSRAEFLGGVTSHVTLETLHEHLDQNKTQTLNLILRADVRGSIEAIRKELTKLEHPEVQLKILQASVGGISEADVYLADASDAIIIGFNVVPDEGARSLAEDRGVQVRRYDIIYKITEELRAALEGMLKPERRDVDLGRALVKRTFTISRMGTIAGCQVLSGTVERNCRIRVIRENRIVGDYALDSLKREKDDAREVRSGYECGMKLAGFNDLKEGDILESYRVEEIARTL